MSPFTDNVKRRTAAMVAMQAYRMFKGEFDPPDDAADLIKDLLHYVEGNDPDHPEPIMMLDKAFINYEAERGRGGDK